MGKRAEKIKITIPSRLEELKNIEKLSCKVSKKMRLTEDERNNLSIAITEAVGNAIIHGNKKDPEKKVSITLKLTDDRIVVEVKDQGKGFDPDSLADPRDPKNLLKENGRGIFILKTLMDKVTYSFSPEGTTLTFIMKKKPKKD